MTEKSPIVIIGGGIGGLSAAIFLSSKNFPVILIEKNQKLGGKLFQYHQDGFRWDTGPSVITMKDVFEDLFTTAGRNLDDYIQLLPVDPITRYFFRDGVILDLWRDISRTLSEIEQNDPKGPEQYLGFLSYAANQFRITNPIYTYGPPPSISSLQKMNLSDLLQLDVFKNYSSSIDERIESKYLRKIFARFATYVGANPFQAPSILSVIAHVELSRGVWYPKGGVYSIALALERLAREMGVSILTGQKVRQIKIHLRQVWGVELDNGSIIKTDRVISNVDYATTQASLLNRSHSDNSKINSYKFKPASSSAFILLLGVKGRHKNLSHHNIIFSENYQNEFDQIFKHKVPPEDPTIYISVTSKSEPDHAPIGFENWYVMVNVPNLESNFNWETHTNSYRDVILSSISKCLGFQVNEKIKFEKLITPRDLEEMTGAFRGSLYGLTHQNWLSAFYRPNPKSKEISGLYFVGGTTHPGGGVPMVILSGKYVSKIIMETRST